MTAEEYAKLKHRVLRRMAELELKQAIADQARTPPLVPAASIKRRRQLRQQYVLVEG